MELQLTDSFDFILNDNVDVDLPSYIVKLDPSCVCRETQRSKLIIAAGVDPKDQKITLITGDGKILVFDAPKWYIPSGPAIPHDGGKQIYFENVKGRWPGNSPGFAASSEWIIEKSTSAMVNPTLKVNYSHEVKTQ